MSVLHDFHPAVAAWFAGAFPAPTPAQREAWPAIRSGRHALVAAPTGSGKTLAAFLAAIDDLVRRGSEAPLPDETAIIYVSPLKALSNDIRINLETPIAGIRAELERLGLPDVAIRAQVRTGDTTTGERNAMTRRPPHILVTTPESLYVLLGSDGGRNMLRTARTVIVDEIHAIAPSKRGSHLALTLQRLERLAGRRLLRVGLSATQKPIDEIARFLVGTDAVAADGTPDCAIVDSGHVRARDLQIEVPATPLEAVISHDVWAQVYERLAALVAEHRTTLVFVNTRRSAERLSRHLAERLGKHAVAAHHGSLAKEIRLDAEQRLKRGELRVLVATASLELGIDIGDVDLVCQIASPRAIAAFLQRVGRSGHAVGGTPKGRLFPTSRDDLAECTALLDAVRRGELDTLVLRDAPLDVLAQQIVAEVAAADIDEAALFALVRGAWPFARLPRETFADVLRMLAEGFTTRRGARAAYLHRDAVNGELRARRGARLTAITSGGAIPDTADYDVHLEPQALKIGTLNEDFAIESLAGDIFQLGNASYRILRVERGRVRVEDAQGAPPNLPFWLGEAPGRSNELSQAVSRLRATITSLLDDGGEPAALAWLVDEVGIAAEAAQQLVDYLARAKAALGVLPTHETLAMERFFDESGGTQLIIHTPYGSRLNRAWGLALRKRFCRTFNFELQAAATEDAIVLSLSTSHSFPLDDVTRFLHSNSVRDVLTQALLDAPMFALRWRWNAVSALALPRFTGGTRVAPQLQRMKSEDLLATVFPDQVACAENLVGERQIPDHPLVAQTLHDCLHEAMDIEGLEALLRRLEAGDARIVARDLTQPSPLAAEVLGAAPYAFLDDAPLEERRTQAVQSRRWHEAEKAEDLGQLDADAIAAVRDEAWPRARDADELHDALMGLGAITGAELVAHEHWPAYADALLAARRATRVRLGANASSPPCELSGLAHDDVLWVAAERLPWFAALHPDATLDPPIAVPAEYAAPDLTADDALVEIVRSRLTGLGPVLPIALADTLGVAPATIDIALAKLEHEGYVMRGHFTPGRGEIEWCERHLLARIHRYTVNRLRREIEPVEPRDYIRFLVDWQHVSADARTAGPDALAAVIAQLEGYEAPAAAWESELLPARVAGYDIGWLDDLCRAGRVAWSRPQRPMRDVARERGAGPVRTTPITLLQRRHLRDWASLAAPPPDVAPVLSSRAQAVHDYLLHHGASFFDELADGVRLLRAELEDALGELVAQGLVSADSFAGLRALLVPAAKRPSAFSRRGRRGALMGLEEAGRWSLVRRAPVAETKPSRRPSFDPESIEHVARTLLRRYGVVFWRVLEREADWLPPWRELLRVYHRLEARGELRGGRFIAGPSGEQFALPQAVGLLRAVRQRERTGTIVTVCGADPLNLVGTVLAGTRVPAVVGSRIAYRDGVPVATLVAGEIAFLETLDAPVQIAVRAALTASTRAASRGPLVPLVFPPDEHHA